MGGFFLPSFMLHCLICFLQYFYKYIHVVFCKYPGLFSIAMVQIKLFGGIGGEKNSLDTPFSEICFCMGQQSTSMTASTVRLDNPEFPNEPNGLPKKPVGHLSWLELQKPDDLTIFTYA